MTGWVSFDRAVPVHAAAALIPRAPGKYAFFVKTLSDLPDRFRAEAITRPVARLVYIGKADTSVYTRVWEQECQHKRPGTFFRSVGAMLGFVSPTGGRNYEFAAADKARVVAWIAEHLHVAWDDQPTIGSHVASEKALIRQFMPLLNIRDNPTGFPELERLRATCRAGQERARQS